MNKLFAILIALLPALDVYEFLPGASFGGYCLLLFSLLVLLKYRTHHIDRVEFHFFLFVFVISIFDGFLYSIVDNKWFESSLLIHNLWTIFIAFVPLVFVIRRVHVETFVKACYSVGILASAIVIWQRLTFILTGSFYNNFYLPMLTVHRDLETMSIVRPAAFLTEPAHLSILLLPILYISLIGNKYRLSALFLFAILCTGSTTGFLMVLILLVWHVFNNQRKRKFLYVTLAVAAISIAYVLISYFYPQILLENFSKLEGTDAENDIRLLGPFAYFQYFGILQHLFGVTLNQLSNYLKTFTLAYAENGNYANGLLTVYFSYGLLGLGVFIHYLYNRWNWSKYAKGFFLILFGVLVSDKLIFSLHYVYLVVFVILSDDIYRYCTMQVK